MNRHDEIPSSYTWRTSILVFECFIWTGLIFTSIVTWLLFPDYMNVKDYTWIDIWIILFGINGFINIFIYIFFLIFPNDCLYYSLLLANLILVVMSVTGIILYANTKFPEYQDLFLVDIIFIYIVYYCVFFVISLIIVELFYWTCREEKQTNQEEEAIQLTNSSYTINEIIDNSLN